MPMNEIILRPGQTVAVKVELGGQQLRLDLSLTSDGVKLRGPMQPVAAQQEPVDLGDDAFESMDQPEVSHGVGHEPVQAVDVSFEEQPDSAPATVQEGDDIDLDLGDLEGDLAEEFQEGTESDDVQPEVHVDAEEAIASIDIPEDADELPPEDSLDMGGDDGFNADGMTMLPPTRKTHQEAPQLDAISATLQPLSLNDPSTDAMSEHNKPQIKPESKPKFAPAPDDTLPVWTGKARAYKDPTLEHKKHTAQINKADLKPPTGQVRPGAKPPLGAKPAPAPAPLQDDGLSLSLDDEEPAAPPAKPALGAKPPVAKKPTGPVGKPAPAAKPSGKAPAAAAGDFTVFLSPPKGADKKQLAAEIIAEIQGINVKEALVLAGKMIVPVVKGVSENEAHSVRDKFKDAGLSCRITQKR
ncbi:MAG: hypothetical protein IPP14_11970 [Planctomycetes bacterium]|nr:hypothetical protein [Planctomycetota bacterium]